MPRRAWALIAFTVAGTGRAQDGEQRLGQIVAQASRATTHRAATRELQSLDPGDAAAMLDALARGTIATGTGTLVLAEHERSTLLDGARLLGRSTFAPLWPEAAGSTEPSRRRAAIELIGATGAASDLRFAILAAASGPGAASADLLAALERTTDALLARDASVLPSLRSSILSSPVAVGCALVHSVGNLESGPALALLSDLLEWQDTLDLPVLAELERVARKLSPPFDDAVCERVRDYATHPDRQVRRNAVLALGELEDALAVPQLLTLAKEDDETVSTAAFRALESITGLKLPRRAGRWESWFAAEVAWSRARRPPLCDTLTAGEPVQVVTALREIAEHRLDRLSLFAATLPCLEHDDERVRAEACSTLGALHPELAAPHLHGALEDPSQQVVVAATQALRRSGRSVP